jgi:hypothetical protein
MTFTARVFSCLALVLVALPGCGGDDEDGCGEANDLAQWILAEAEKDGIAPESVCEDPDRPEKYDEACEKHAGLMAECDD